MKISSIFVAFLENMNFIRVQIEILGNFVKASASLSGYSAVATVTSKHPIHAKAYFRGLKANVYLKNYLSFSQYWRYLFPQPLHSVQQGLKISHSR